MKYDDRNEAAIKTCDPVAQVAMRHFLYRLRRVGEDVLITEGFRDKAGQEKDFANGTSQVHFPYSFHNHGVAIDLAPVLFGQTAIIYNAAGRYEKIARVAAQCAFQWGFQMWGFDKPHFQYTQGHDIQHFISGASLSMEVARASAKEFYEQTIDQLTQALKFASPARAKQLTDEIAYVRELMKK
jgi:hypothetical protein